MRIDLATGVGYPDFIDYPSLPATVVDITDDEFAAVQAAAQGSTFTMSNDVLVITPPAPPTDAQLLAAAKATQTAMIQQAYALAITAPVSYTTDAGTTAQFAQDAASKANLVNALLGSQKTSTWLANLWLDTAGQPIVPFTYSDLQGLSAAMEAQEVPQYHELLLLVGEINAATKVAAVQAIVWPSS